jgi:FkbM family methyltransferase
MLYLKSRFKSSFVRDFYWAFAHRRRLDVRRKEVQFYASVLEGLERGCTIFDIGANEGAKSDAFLRLGARVVAVDPDDMCCKNLEARFLKYRLRPRPVTVVASAVSGSIGTAEMLIDGPGSAINTMNPKWAESLKQNRDHFEWTHCGLVFTETKLVKTTTIDALIAQHGMPFFVKIDVEGHELDVLRGLHRPVPYLSFEVNLPDFRSEGLECVKELSKLASDGQFNYIAECGEGLKLKKWVSAREFSEELEQCGEKSIEIFWKTQVALAN